jgi:hypothetical protein
MNSAVIMFAGFICGWVVTELAYAIKNKKKEN